MKFYERVNINFTFYSSYLQVVRDDEKMGINYLQWKSGLLRDNQH